MATKLICDVCNKEVKELNIIMVRNVSRKCDDDELSFGKKIHTFDSCDDCMNTVVYRVKQIG